MTSPLASTPTSADSYPHPRWLIIGLSLLLFNLLLVNTLRQPPHPLDANAPPAEFSAQRARQSLEHLLESGAPHPVGSPDHERMRQQVIAEFKASGVPVETQEMLSCNSTAPEESVVSPKSD